MKKTFNSIEEILADVKLGKPIIVVDSEDRENEGDLVVAGEKISAEVLAFMIKDASGLMCIPMSKEIAQEKGIELLEQKNSGKTSCNFGTPVDCKLGTTTGMSAFDRMKTIQALCDKNSKPNDFLRPGHLFPLIAKSGGVLERQGHTEAAIDLCELSELKKVAVICEIIKENGEMARLPDLLEFKKKFELKIISIEQIISHKKKNTEKNPTTVSLPEVELFAETILPTKNGEFKMLAFKALHENVEYIALVKGEVEGKENVLTRLHSQCLTGDTFGSQRCDCQNQLHESMKKIQKENGIIVYMGQEGRGIGLLNKIKTYELQDKGFDTVQANEMLGFKADLREYNAAAEILHMLGVRSVRLLTNNPQKIKEIESFGINVSERVPIITEKNKYNKNYLETKAKKFGHFLK
ncbi:MAG: GTP cyclohydrolase II [Candidatus Diapherotrites archaeon]|nr:GTP cyclohydrolase II [Candidatus Diapherotrites archaeon]